MRVGDRAHAWTHPSHVGQTRPRPRLVLLLRVVEWNSKRLWRVRFLDEVNSGELDYNEDCLMVVESDVSDSEENVSEEVRHEEG